MTAKKNESLFNPLVDFLCLGGFTFFVIPLAYLIPEENLGLAFICGLFLANFLNHPHFAHSYQIFYKNFTNKIRGKGYEPFLQKRYIFAGIIIPLILIGLGATGILFKNLLLLGFMANIMLFLVGWHYVKQGYGILIVDSVYKKQFFSNPAKKAFLYNAYVFWIFYWLTANWYFSGSNNNFMGISYITFPIPFQVIVIMGALASLTSLWTIYHLFKHWQKNKSLPINGLTAYVVTLYIWLVGRLAPGALIFIPALHSLQYLVVVYRYQLNSSSADAQISQDIKGRAAHEMMEAAADNKSQKPLPQTFKEFVIAGFVFGVLGFWLIPALMTMLFAGQTGLMGSFVFFFVVWIFINVHHYFMDNVMWRKENPETKKHLFG